MRYAIERKRAEDALRRSMDGLRGQLTLWEAALTALPHGVLIAGADGAIALVNPAARELLSVDALSAQIGDREAGFWQNIAGVAAAQALPLARALAEQGPVADVYALLGDAGPRRIAARAQRLLATDGTLLGAIALLEEVDSRPA